MRAASSARRQQIVGDAGRELRDHVGGRRHDERDVGLAHEADVRDAFGRVPQRGVDRPRGQRRERQRRDEALGFGGHDDVDDRAALHERARERRGLVGRDPAADAEKNARCAVTRVDPQVVDQPRAAEARRADDERGRAQAIERLERVGVDDVEVIELRRRGSMRAVPARDRIALRFAALERVAHGQQRAIERRRRRALRPQSR